MELKVRRDALGSRVAFWSMKNVFDAIRDMEDINGRARTADERVPCLENLTQHLLGMLACVAFNTNVPIPEFIKEERGFEKIFLHLASRANIILEIGRDPRGWDYDLIMQVEELLKSLRGPSVFKEKFRKYCESRNRPCADEDDLALSVLEYLVLYNSNILETFRDYTGDNTQDIFERLKEFFPEIACDASIH